MNKEKIEFIKLSLLFTGVLLTTYTTGVFITKEYGLIFINIIIGIFAISVLGVQAYAAFTIYSLFLVRKSVMEVGPVYLSGDDEDRYLNLSDIDNLVKPMSPVEFLEFLNKDRYGNDNPDKEAILNLLNMIQGRKGYEEKEKFIYMKLSSLD